MRGGGGVITPSLSSDSSPLGNKYAHSYTPVYGAEMSSDILGGRVALLAQYVPHDIFSEQFLTHFLTGHFLAGRNGCGRLPDASWTPSIR